MKELTGFENYLLTTVEHGVDAVTFSVKEVLHEGDMLLVFSIYVWWIDEYVVFLKLSQQIRYMRVKC